MTPELPWKGQGLPYHLQPAAEAASLAPLAKGTEAEEEAAAPEEEEAAAAAAAAAAAGMAAGGGYGGAGETGAAAGGAFSGEGAGEGGHDGEGGGEDKKKAGEGEGKMEGPREGDVAGEVYATPSSPKRVSKGGQMQEVVDGDVWRIAREYAAMLKGAPVEIRGQQVTIEAPLVQVRK